MVYWRIIAVRRAKGRRNRKRLSVRADPPKRDRQQKRVANRIGQVDLGGITGKHLNGVVVALFRRDLRRKEENSMRPVHGQIEQVERPVARHTCDCRHVERSQNAAMADVQPEVNLDVGKNLRIQI